MTIIHRGNYSDSLALLNSSLDKLADTYHVGKIPGFEQLKGVGA